VARRFREGLAREVGIFDQSVLEGGVARVALVDASPHIGRLLGVAENNPEFKELR
jgi:hypothetical protein